MRQLMAVEMEHEFWLSGSFYERQKPAFWLKETMNQTDKKIVKTISWWKAAAEPVYALSSNSGCDMVFLDPSDKAMMQTVFWKSKRQTEAGSVL